MTETFPAPRAAFANEGDNDTLRTLREMGSRAHQLRAATRAADHFNANDNRDDRDTGSWLMSCALGMAGELATDLDGVARALKDRPAENSAQLGVAALRRRAHELHAAARAADHFLDLDGPEDRETGSWLIATAHQLARKLAAEIDDSLGPVRRPVVLDKSGFEAHDPAFARRVAAATAPLRGAA